MRLFDRVLLVANGELGAAGDNADFEVAIAAALRDQQIPWCRRLLVTTTTEHLAIRLGQALEKAFDGKVLFGFSHENKLAHVWWHRGEAA